MAWLYLPGVEDSNSDSPLRSELITEQSPTLKGNVRPLRSWQRTWNAGGWIRLLSGMTLEPSQAMSLAHSWIRSTLSQPGSPVSPGVSQEGEQEPPTTDGSGPTSSRFLGQFTPNGRFLKTSPDFFEADSDPSSVTLPRSGSMRSGQVFEQPMSAHRTGGKESSFWATPTASDDEHKVTVNSLQPGLVGEVDRFSGRPVQEALKIGGKLSKSDQTSLPRLNPKFVEWLMGWPQGWLELTGSASSGTE